MRPMRLGLFRCQFGIFVLWRQLCEAMRHVVGDGAETLQLGTIQCLCIGNVDGKWVARHVIDTKLVMQMRAGSPAGLANIADDVALPDLGTFPQSAGEAAHMRISGRIIRPMFDDDDVAETVLRADEVDGAITGRLDRRANGSCEVDTLMLFPSAQNRVQTHRKT